jgi:WD40 repeat protein
LDVVSLADLVRFASGRSMKGTPRCAAFSSDGEAIVVGKFNGNVAVFRKKEEGRFAQDDLLLTQHRGRVEDIQAFSTYPGVISAGEDGVIRFVNLRDSSIIGEAQAPFGQATSLHISPDGALMAVGFSQAGSTRSEVSLWDLHGLLTYLALVNPFASATSLALRDIRVSMEDTGLSPGTRLALEYAECVLLHRFQYDIEIGAPPTIMAGEFDIEID